MGHETVKQMMVNEEMEPSNKLEARPLPYPDGFLGKHRISAAIARLNHEIQLMEEELKLVDSMGTSSIACKELVLNVERKPDGLLPMTKGPVNVAWDRWFQGSHDSHSHRRRIQKRPDVS